MIGLIKPALSTEEEEAAAKRTSEIYDDEKREADCIEYLESAVAESIAIFGDKHRCESVPYMLAALLADEVIILNCFHWKEDWPEDARAMTSMSVNCNDVFMWACADAETITYAEIPDLYAHWIADKSSGPAIWCIKKRNVMPQKPVENMIRKKGIWDFEAMNLDPNPVEEYYRKKAEENATKAPTNTKED